MSMLNIIKAKLGQAANTTYNFLFDASAADGTLKLVRESGQDILTVDANGNVLVDGNNLNLFSAKSLAANGYQKLPSGLIIQWGTTPALDTSPVAVTFAIAFPSVCVSVALTNAAATNINVAAFNRTTTKFDGWASIGGNQHHYVAIGY